MFPTFDKDEFCLQGIVDFLLSGDFIGVVVLYSNVLLVNPTVLRVCQLDFKIGMRLDHWIVWASIPRLEMITSDRIIHLSLCF